MVLKKSNGVLEEMGVKSAFIVSVVFLVACSTSDNVAKVGKDVVTSEEFEAHLSYKRINPDQAERVEAELSNVIQQTALAQAIASTELLDEALLKAEFEEFKNQMTISRYMASFLDKAVTDTAVENYYNSNQDEYSRSQAHVAHIVFRVHSAMTNAEQQAQQQKAREIVAKLAKGESFETLAQTESDDLYSAEKGGDLGWVSADAIDPSFAVAIQELEVDQVSDVVKTQYGYHIIKMLSPLKQDVAPLDQVAGDIRYLLRQKAKAAEIERLLATVSIKRLGS